MKKRPVVSDLVADTYVPRMFKVRQTFSRPKIEREDIPAHIQDMLSNETFAGKIRPGMEIAITCGSRGIANLDVITKSIVDFVKSCGATPFIVPAMGSHGGATAEGQRAVIEGYGVTEEAMGCEIRSSMETVKIGVNEEGVEVFIDKNAAEADGIIVNCRVKPHTAFRGRYESGIMKMMTIGLGKQHGAEQCHESGFKHMAKNVLLFGRTILKNAPILFAVAAIENAYDETARLVAVDACDIEAREPELLREAFDNMARILVDSCDVLIVDRIGKNYSGDGMDPNVTGTFCTPYASGGLNAQRVCVLDLSDETHGNACGIGMASATTQRAYEKMELSQMYCNAITSTVLSVIRIPMIMESDKEAIQVCIKSCNEIDKRNPRVVRISNSMQLGEIMLSEAYWDEAAGIEGLEIISQPEELPFDEKGNLW